MAAQLARLLDNCQSTAGKFLANFSEAGPRAGMRYLANVVFMVAREVSPAVLGVQYDRRIF
jgi:hypothetical protein